MTSGTSVWLKNGTFLSMCLDVDSGTLNTHTNHANYHKIDKVL